MSGPMDKFLQGGGDVEPKKRETEKVAAALKKRKASQTKYAI